MGVKTYDPKQVAVIVGSQPLTGFGDGDFVSVERNEDAWTLMVGADGESTRSKNNNRSGKITITLQQSSRSNDYLSQLALADELSGRATTNVMIKDNFGTTLYNAATAWIVKQPAITFAKEAGSREWVLETDELIGVLGGNE